MIHIVVVLSLNTNHRQFFTFFQISKNTERIFLWCAWAAKNIFEQILSQESMRWDSLFQAVLGFT
jgi:hypothetical protein